MTDVAKIGGALERPGIDPRKFVDLAIVTAYHVGSDGVHADVIASDGMEETVALAPPYGGAGFGLYAPLQLDDALLIAIPDGKYNAGARVVGRIWDPGSPPPDEAIAHPQDLVVVVRPGQSMRIVVKGGGNVEIEAQDGGHVRLGGASATKPVQTTADGVTFLAAVDAAVAATSGTSPQGAAFGTALKSALQTAGWPVGSSVARATP